MIENKSIVEKLTKFHKINDDLEDVEVKINDEDKTLILLGSLPWIFFEHFKDYVLYGKDAIITLDEVQTTIQEILKAKDLKIDNNGESLNVSRRGSECKWMYKFKRFGMLRL